MNDAFSSDEADETYFPDCATDAEWKLSVEMAKLLAKPEVQAAVVRTMFAQRNQLADELKTGAACAVKVDELIGRVDRVDEATSGHGTRLESLSSQVSETNRSIVTLADRTEQLVCGVQELKIATNAIKDISSTLMRFNERVVARMDNSFDVINGEFRELSSALTRWCDGAADNLRDKIDETNARLTDLSQLLETKLRLQNSKLQLLDSKLDQLTTAAYATATTMETETPEAATTTAGERQPMDVVGASPAPPANAAGLCDGASSRSHPEDAAGSQDETALQFLPASKCLLYVYRGYLMFADSLAAAVVDDDFVEFLCHARSEPEVVAALEKFDNVAVVLGYDEHLRAGFQVNVFVARYNRLIRMLRRHKVENVVVAKVPPKKARMEDTRYWKTLSQLNEGIGGVARAHGAAFANLDRVVVKLNKERSPAAGNVYFDRAGKPRFHWRDAVHRQPAAAANVAGGKLHDFTAKGLALMKETLDATLRRLVDERGGDVQTAAAAAAGRQRGGARATTDGDAEIVEVPLTFRDADGEEFTVTGKCRVVPSDQMPHRGRGDIVLGRDFMEQYGVHVDSADGRPSVVMRDPSNGERTIRLDPTMFSEVEEEIENWVN